MDSNNVNEEDEDIVIKGTSLYEHLHKLGYTDFESVTVYTSMQKDEEKGSMFADDSVSKKQVETILDTKALLHDHACTIQNLLDEHNSNSWRCFQYRGTIGKQAILRIKLSQKYRIMFFMESLISKKIQSFIPCLVRIHLNLIHLKTLILLDKCYFVSRNNPIREQIKGTITLLKVALFGATISTSVYIPFKTQYKSSSLFGLSLLFYVSYIEYSRVRAHRDLKSVIALQNDIFDLCKKGLKILKYGYKIKLNKERGFQQFYDLTAGRFRHLQSITEEIVKCLEHISCTSYRVSLVLTQLLPANVFHENLLTKFDGESFELRGEITYQKLRNLYYTYILTQSETLQLVAIAYDYHTWQQSYRKIPEFKLAHIIGFLIKRLVMYKIRLTESVNAYYNFKLEPTLYKYKGSAAQRWQNLYMHLYLASNKLEISYGRILSILGDIDNDVYENMTDEDMVQNIMQKLNAIQKDVENAKNFLEYSSLHLVKSNLTNTTNLMPNTFEPVEKFDIPVVHDSEPQIMDEVFEEYIKNEYFKPLSEEDNEIILYNDKKNKLMFKNFMIELKDVLVDKQKLMFERESKALQRMRKNETSETTLANQDDHDFMLSQISSNASTEAYKQITNDQKCNEKRSNKLFEENKVVTTILKSEETLKKENLCDSSDEEKPVTLPTAFLPNREFSLFLPPPFLKTNEETFMGSGENSEDEIMEVQSEK